MRNFKLVLFAIILSITSIFIYSCSKESNSDKTSTLNIESRTTASGYFVRNGETFYKDKVSVNCTTSSCEGNNSGHTDHCQVSSDMNGRFECTCSGCKMTVVVSSINSDDDLLAQIQKENLHLAEFADFTERKHGEKILSYNRVEFDFQPEVTTITYIYELSDGSEESVMYANTYDPNTGAIGPTYEIDCTGSCGCKEQFDFNTNKASCSCDDCKMKVTVTN